VVPLPEGRHGFWEADRCDRLGRDLPAACSGRIHPIDETLVSWYGPHIPRAIETVRSLLAASSEA